ncbi:ShlB/FhaC/HecB family hemolysin secretion/activation protein [Xenorhabdus sp. KK7.4]|uniref:ShlB/FhaC/HecB family hemolysin secretion/activation protein n=1 Tax=Xenorhabdus sp. KK7.4 TaxID=1851572 RepID=UPI000C04B4B1|nr:ShlB/FhaC/HecB family hemolysin secretion/activation protein [Xenorhabdus sp. KK7.4]PHM59300.1 XhlB [Xenorhabdus sp. KK7.4]
MFKRTAVFILLSVSLQASALPEAPDAVLSIDEARRTLQDSSREIDQLIEQRRYRGFIERSDTLSPETVSPVLTEAPACLDISGVYLQGITLLSLAELDTLSALPEQCITSNDINRLTAEITNLYIAKGYITARVQFIPPSYNRELGLSVIEGFVEAIEGGDRWVNSRMLFPGLINQPLNLNQLDQGLDQSNRLQSNKTTLDILPGTVSGGSIVRLHNRHSTPWHLSAITDNYGQKSTGKWISRLNASFDSPLGLSDFVSVNGVSTIDKPSTQYNRAATLFYSLPYGAVTFSGFTSYSQYKNQLKLQRNSFKLSGNSQQSGMRIDWLFHRSQSQISTLNTQFVYKDSNTYFNESKFNVSSQKLAVLSLGISHLQIIPNGLITFDTGIEQGTPWLGAQTATHNLNERFTKGKLSVNLHQNFKLFTVPYRLSSQFYTQYSPNGLPGVEWLNITDRNAVRGFSKNTLSADNGWYLRNTLSYAIPLPESSLTLRVGADVGQVKSHNRQEASWSSNAGVSVGAALRHQHFLADIEVSRGKTLSHQDRDKSEPIQLLTRFSYLF